MENKHTPGPWTSLCISKNGLTVAQIIVDEDLSETDLANARLIASAPDLLAALESLKAVCADVLMPSINEAIRQGFKMETWTPEQMQLAKAVELTDAAIAKAKSP